ncbi:P-loop containing nucleoside triphosphate hydrolase protein [Aspergillus pseudonomiae]|uniref:Ribosome assembly protein 1 n=1 Tax=Aspergillus pseudonomiae TaxID=1506151 RepID=A0A5N7CXU8_9EURO|nr:P-loop containing nucleoside triphosphate hydrolase protein [Aspergillus pseudonomiae]KAB8261739.1 P-loop containing nucleoside triphosphate hydrolase protein [Aspergillus pseudonomiae]KAE8398378.1 P-loop containing nucleoside triphosphate hydrolase protein [Aspergillus pseudonomiae]
MPVVNVEDLVRLQQKPDDIRNICILAHVDHGKTSLTDSLIATNGIISPKLAGKIRYLDSRPDEQLRGITMESSAISLFFSMMRRPAPDAAPVAKEYLINLIDSPGHIDFSSEVSTASRLCDGAIVLVDAVEGVCSQTVTVLRQSWVEQLKPILVINKIDRLVTELKMSPSEAYSHMSKLLEQVNAVIGSFYQGERMEEDLQWRERMEERANAAAEKDRTKKQTHDDESTSADAAEYVERDDEDLYFAPEKNNVIFCSAVDGWAFTIRQFAAIYEKKLGIKRAILEKVLWGDYYLDPKTKRVLGQKHLKGRALKPMFVQLVLDSIWAAYEATTGGGKGKGDPALLEKITKSLNINIPAYILRSRDPRNIMTTLFSMWLPLSTAVLVSVIEYLPSPRAAQEARLPALIEESPGSDFADKKVKDAMINFKTSSDEPVVAYVSKMVAIPESELSSSKKRSGATMSADEAREIARKKREEIAKMQAEANGEQQDDGYARITSAFENVTMDDNNQAPEEDEKEDPEHLIGFARLYSGTLSVGDSVYVLAPKFSPETPNASPVPQKVTVTDLYLLMGRSLEPLKSVPAGVIFGIGGLAGHVLKTGTLCSQLEGSINLAGVSLNTPPIVRVALEPANPADLGKMVTGLRLLEQSDPCAQYDVLPNGEHVILTAGELHLERCLKDLRERFAKCDIQTGETIVPYRETIVSAPEMAAPKNPDLGRGGVLAVSASKQLSIRLRVVPLPEAVTDYFTKHVGTIKRLQSQRHTAAEDKAANGTPEGTQQVETGDATDEAREGSILSLKDFRDELNKIFDEEVKEDKDLWKDVVDRITAFGPRRVGPNILVDATAVNTCEKFLLEDPKQQPTVNTETSSREALIVRDFCDKITYAFQLATGQGPLCQEPMQGTAVFLEEIAVNASEEELDLGRLTGEAIRLVRESISQGFLDWSPRIMLAMYSCEIQASTEVLGRVYGVITRRRGRILSETMKEGTPFFTILALLPVAESFGFAEEIRKRTSGAAQPQLIFAGFEALDEDPFWVPATEEELEDLGELADRENVAKRYMDAVRTRKGLVVQGRKLIDAEKQKTLKK